ncbi:MAG: pyruvate ferredoxin oxidoreductase [Desulfobacterales bacterium]|jgi:2-oxoglutarate ferredoxin oxidoreductase subunit gamma|nr:pyruvate ferredoxin oxidoreductase [Desulfobacteraceae bacterium]MBT7084802.1 pyruvate ferredoxin oxidoreductase [Desulfobacterales bacterium]MBT7698331.1 pyruvate ferredoxin oxidoreductase [Desulfobacterales bacterium]
MTNIQDNKKEVVITGFGGQGIVLAGTILGKAAALGDHRESTLVQSYGPESRGGACSAQVVISDTIIFYPYIKTPDVLVCMSQGGYDKYIGDLPDDGILIIDHDLVKAKRKVKEFYSISATRIAEELGRKMMANIIMIGFVTAVTKIISMDAAQDTVVKSVPKGTEEMNLKAFNRGSDYGLSVLKGREKKAEGRTGAVS